MQASVPLMPQQQPVGGDSPGAVPFQAQQVPAPMAPMPGMPPGAPMPFAAAPAPIAAMPVMMAPAGATISPGGSRSSASAFGQSQGRRQSDKSLFVSGLHPDCEFTHLHERFGAYGKLISCRVLRDAKSGNSRCIGYVNFAYAEHAAAAIACENGKHGPQYGGPMTVRYAEDDPAFVPEETRKLFVRYVPLECTVDLVRDAFSTLGVVTDVSVMPDISSASKNDSEPWNMAYVSFASAEEATQACAKSHRSNLLGPRHELIVKPAESLATRAQRQRKNEGSASSRSGSHFGSMSQAAVQHQLQQQAIFSMSGSGSGRQPGAAPPVMPQVAPQFVAPPGYQVAYMPGANGQLTPVLIPAQPGAAVPAPGMPPAPVAAAPPAAPVFAQPIAGVAPGPGSAPAAAVPAAPQ